VKSRNIWKNRGFLLGLLTLLTLGTATLSMVANSNQGRIEKPVFASETITLSNLGTSLGTTSNTSILQTTVNGYSLNYLQGKKQTVGTSHAILLAKSTGAFISNDTPIPGTIVSTKVSILSGASGSTTYYCHFAATEFLSAGSGGTAVNITGGNSHVYTNSTPDATYFCISLGNANNGQVLSLEIIYDSTPTKTLTGIAVTKQPDKLSYYRKELFDSTGMEVMASYSDLSSEIVTTTYSTEPLTVGTTSIVLSYTYGEVTKTTSVAISVSDRNLISIEITTNPTKMTYSIGQPFDPTGMVVKADYDAGSSVFDYDEYIYSPEEAFSVLGENTVTITSTESALISDALTVIVIAQTEGIYTITSATTTYTPTPIISNLSINKSDEELGDITYSDNDNFRLGGSPNTADMMIGANDKVGGAVRFTLPSGLFATEVQFIGMKVDAGKNPVLSINSELSFTYSSSTATLKPYANSILISTIGTSRIWVSSITIIAKVEGNSALDYGTHFIAKTASECSTLSVSSSTWASLKDIYDAADADLQYIIKTTEADVDGTDLEKAIARYTYICKKYGYDNYLFLVLESTAHPTDPQSYHKEYLTLAISLIAISGASLIGWYYITKKRAIS
jgi:hypothetical protein